MRHFKRLTFYFVLVFGLIGFFSLITGRATIPAGEGKGARGRDVAGWEARLWGVFCLIPAAIYIGQDRRERRAAREKGGKD